MLFRSRERKGSGGEAALVSPPLPFDRHAIQEGPGIAAGAFCVVPKMGLEPTRLAALVPETSASTNSATSAHLWYSRPRSGAFQGSLTL